jgi:DNA-binding MarR family transcriptional regulator
MTSVVQRILRQKSPLPSAEVEAWLGLQIAAHRVTDPWFRFLKSQDLPHPQYNVLRILRGARPEALTCGEIAERMIVRDPDITRLLDRLERKGFITRTRDTEDRRVVRTAISPAGLAELERLDAVIPVHPLHQVLGSLGKTRLKQLNDLLADIIERSTPDTSIQE